MKKLFIFFLSFIILPFYGQNIEKTIIVLPQNEMTIDSVLIQIKQTQNVVFSYSNNLFENKKVHFQNTTLRLIDIIKTISEQTETNYKIQGNKILFYPKKMKLRITGSVVAETGEKLADVNVGIRESGSGTISNINGGYTLLVEPGYYIIVFSYVGYQTEERKIVLDQELEVNIALKIATQNVDEVKVTSKLRKFYDLDIGRPLESVNAKSIENANLSNASDILHGRMSGVWATQTSGLPGDHQRVRIRGISSIYGSVDPLYVVDGVSVPTVNLNSLGIADLNTHDIENITVLKDASSTALFGYQGGNGVILIDTKRGKKENHINFSTRQGIQWFSGRYDLMGTKDFLASIDSSDKLVGTNLRYYYPTFDTILQKPVYADTLASTNWQDKIFQMGQIHEFQLSGSGTIKNTGFYISGNYVDNIGVIRETSYKRYTASVNAEHTFFDKLTVEAGYRGSYQANNNNVDGYGGNKIIFEGINKSPCMLSTPDSLYFHPKDKYRVYRIYQHYKPLNLMRTTDTLIKYTNRLVDIAANTFRGSINYNVTRDLSVKISSDLSVRNYHYLANIGNPNDESYTYYSDFSSDPSYIKNIDSYENIVVINNQCNLKWQKRLNNHSFKILAGAKFYNDNVYWKDSVPNFYGNEIRYIEGFDKTNDAYIRNSMAIHGPHGAVVRQLNSYLGNFNYNYKEKYFLSIAGNYENLIEGERMNAKKLFPSVALNYDLAREYGFNKIKWLNHFNLYANWGRAGNYPLNGLSNDIYSSQNYINFGNVITTGKYVYTLSNHNLTQETLEEYDFGTSIDLFKDSRVKIGGDYYLKSNSNLIVLRDIPAYYGSGKMYYNVGEIETKGKELTIELIPIVTKDFSWYTKFNITTFSQSVKKLTSDSVIKIIDNEDILVPDFYINTNQGLGDIYGYQYLGRVTPTDKQDKRYIRYGTEKYVNADSGDFTLNEKDKMAIGNSMPKFTWNWYHSFTYKNFTLDMLWYAVVGVKKYNATRAGSYIAATNRELNNFINDTLKAYTTSVFYESSYFVEDASFIRLKQLTLSFEPTKKFYNRVSMKFSITLENFLLITKYKGYDPESTIYTDNNFSDNAIDRGAYPNPKAFLISISLTLY
jgi:TonB-dependent starch-binding outer membrane protein SusC